MVRKSADMLNPDACLQFHARRLCAYSSAALIGDNGTRISPLSPGVADQISSEHYGAHKIIPCTFGTFPNPNSSIRSRRLGGDP